MKEAKPEAPEPEESLEEWLGKPQPDQAESPHDFVQRRMREQAAEDEKAESKPKA
jgi:hypothetical protein